MKKTRVTVWAAILAAGMMTALCSAQDAETTAEAAVAEAAEKAEDSAEAAAKAEDAAEAAAEAETAEAKPDTAAVAGADEMAPVEDVVDEDMVPIYGTDIKDGVYPVAVDSSSSMFKITDCELTVKDGEMTAKMTMGGKGYLYLYMGTGLEAAASSETGFIEFEENEDGEHTFTVPVEALDMGIDCAAFSKKKEQWYDRTLVFRSDSLPQDAFAAGMITTLEDLGLEDGSYQVEVAVEGGSGKATVESPAQMTVADGKAVATLIWSSPYYDYMIVGEEKLEPVNGEGENSTFEVPVEGFDWNIAAVADTIAMSTPHEIEYTLIFDSSSIQKAEQ